MNNSILALLAIGFGVGCAADMPTAPKQSDSGLSPAFAASADAAAAADAAVGPACGTVRGTIIASVVPGQAAAGTIDGDLQGTITTVLVPDPVGATDKSATGWANHLTGRQTVEVEGSSIPALVGRTITWMIDSRSMSPPPILQVSNTIRIVEGATGNLVSHGILDLTTLTTHFQYEGVICP